MALEGAPRSCQRLRRRPPPSPPSPPAQEGKTGQPQLDGRAHRVLDFRDAQSGNRAPLDGSNDTAIEISIYFFLFD